MKDDEESDSTNNHVVFRSQLVRAVAVHLSLEVLGSSSVDESLAHPSDQDLLVNLQRKIALCHQQ
jgi:hypothetical protein